jgi:hypothetical protein
MTGGGGRLDEEDENDRGKWNKEKIWRERIML